MYSNFLDYQTKIITFSKTPTIYIYVKTKTMSSENRRKKSLIIERNNRKILGESEMDCPEASENLKLNTENRDKSIKAEYIKYGPLNVDEPGNYWVDLAKHWETTEEAAKKSLCGNCVAFDISERMKECMPGKTSDGDGELGYCWMHNFKCHSARTCRTWAKGGPITEDKISYDWQSRQ
jgi:hypothetical protein